jgi:hypothetical protein
MSKVAQIQILPDSKYLLVKAEEMDTSRIIEEEGLSKLTAFLCIKYASL